MKRFFITLLLAFSFQAAAQTLNGQFPPFFRQVTANWRSGITGIPISTWQWPANQGGDLIGTDESGFAYIEMLNGPLKGSLTRSAWSQPTIAEPHGPTVLTYTTVFPGQTSFPFTDSFSIQGNLGGLITTDTTLTVTVTLLNTPPTFTQDLNLATPVFSNSAPVSVDLLSVALDAESDPLFVASVGTITPAGCGSLTWNAQTQGGLFTPTNNIVGTCSIRYRVRDRFLTSTTEGTLNVNIVSCTTAPEVCNGLDDNCNGMVDEGFALATCGAGACARTGTTCTASSCTPGTPATEVCNAIDDDCDGVIDNGLALATCGMGSCSRTGTTCAASSCTPGASTAETCNTLDDDCDGMIDDGLALATCGVGACASTGLTCSAASCTPGASSAETCNTLDDDCDGAVDDGLALATCGVGACASTGTTCDASSCTPGASSAETCNRVDDDCDGMIDDGLTLATCGVGACASTGTTCAASSCTPGESTSETCNAVDDDCDGVIDDGACDGGIPAFDAGTSDVDAGTSGAGTFDAGNPGGGAGGGTGTPDGGSTPAEVSGCTCSTGSADFGLMLLALGALLRRRPQGRR